MLIAGAPSHPAGVHEFRAGARLLARCLEGVPDLVVDVHDHGRIPDFAASEVSAVVLYSDGGPSHPLAEDDRLDALEALAERGVGLGFLHYAIEPPAGKGASKLTQWIGGIYVEGVSCNPIWSADIHPAPDHPITRGVVPFRTVDEWYFGLAVDDDPHVTPILDATPSDEVRAGPYVWPAGPYPHIVAAAGRRETLMWAFERPDGGRGIGLGGGHFHANWANDDFRRVVLNALVWVTGADVPREGVSSSVAAADLERDLDGDPR